MPIHKKPGKNLKNQIYSQVFDSIIRGEYQPDDILSEKALVEKFSVSKSPVREALIELCNEGVLRSIPRYGYEVVRLTDTDVEEIRDYRLIMECGCLERYWEKITPDHVEKLQHLLDQRYQGETEWDVLEHWAYNTDFHLELMLCYSNQYAYRSLKSTLRVLSRAYAQFYWDKWHQTTFFSSASLHKKLLEAVRANDRDRAVECLRLDISGFEDEDQHPSFRP